MLGTWFGLDPQTTDRISFLEVDVSEEGVGVQEKRSRDISMNKMSLPLIPDKTHLCWHV